MRLLARALACLVLLCSAAVADPTRVALVIGNGAYTDVPPLPNPASDAEAVGQALRDVGFTQVTVAKDLNHQALYDALRHFAQQSETADWSVLYYAGHGIEVGGKNYLVPVDAHLAADRDVDFEAVPMQVVLASVGGARRLRLVILDACRDNPFLNKMAHTAATRSIERGLARVAPEGDLYLVYSAKSGQVAVDGASGRSPFVAALLKNIEMPGLEINLLFRRVHADVKQASDGRQEPDFEGTLPADELYFKAPGNGAPVLAAAASPPPAVAPPPIAPPPVVPGPPSSPAAPKVAAAEPTTRTTVSQPTTYAYVDGLDPSGDNFLALKAGPSIGAQRLMKLGPGTLLSTVGQSGKWLHVRLRTGETGWVFNKYVSCCRQGPEGVE